jgi:Tfp pilus assembly protein PilF
MRQDYEAEMSLLKAIQLDRRFSDAWCSLANFRLANAEYRKARYLLLRSLVADRQNHQAWSLLADVFSQLGNPEKSKICQEQAQSLAPASISESSI